jgi:hypothetical protein
MPGGLGVRLRSKAVVCLCSWFGWCALCAVIRIKVAVNS